VIDFRFFGYSNSSRSHSFAVTYGTDQELFFVSVELDRSGGVLESGHGVLAKLFL
jgi:hypothetical protein